MIRWFQKLTTPSKPSSPQMVESNATGSPILTASFASDPTKWEGIFEQSWHVAEAVMERKVIDVEHDITYDEMTELVSEFTMMTQLLMMEVNAQPESAIGPILDRFFSQQIFDRLLDWAIQIPETLKAICQLSLIRVYECIVSESHTQNHCLLVHKPILNPLLRLFGWCRRNEGRSLLGPLQTPNATDRHFVLLLYQICTKLAEDKTLLHFFFTCQTGGDQFIVFSLLIPFLYEQNEVGQLARDALLLVLSVSVKHDEISEFVAYRSAFCAVVATGLSGCFSQLSRVLAHEGSDRLVPEYSTESFSNFLSSLLFCNAVVQVAHPLVVEQICNFFYSGFLISVVKPTLLQDELEGAAACTAYLEAACGVLTETSLIRTLIRLLLVERDDCETPLIQVVVSRVSSSNARLASVSLSLLDTLLQLGCEDLMLVLIFRYLIPQRDTNRTQMLHVKENVPAIAQRLLDCIPQPMYNFAELCSQNTLEVYMREGALLVDERSAMCASWKWRYDGTNPGPQLFRADTDDESSLTHSPFSRLSSCRSSMSMAQLGINRYASARRPTYLANESSLGRLAELGGRASGSLDSDSVGEDEEFILPAITASTMMSSSMIDYLTTTFDDMSESDESQKGVTTVMKNSKESNHDASARSDDSHVFDTDAEMARSFILSGWAQVEDLDTFASLLDRQKRVDVGSMPSIAQLTSFIDAKLQIMNELKADEGQEFVKGDATAAVDVSNDGKMLNGQAIEEGVESSLLLHRVFSLMESWPDLPSSTCFPLALLMTTIASYPQLQLFAFLFDTQHEDHVPRLILIMEDVKKRLERRLKGVSDTWITRTLRTLNTRADRIDRQADSARGDTWDPHALESFSRSRAGGSSGRRVQQGYRYHLHKAVESEYEVSSDANAKHVAHAAVAFTTLCQMLSSIVMSQSSSVLRNG